MGRRWALVKDPEIATKMVKFIELNTIGVSKDSQLRTARMLSVISNSCELLGNNSDHNESFYGFGHRLMTERWRRLRQAVKHGGMFSLPDFPTAYCTFLGQPTETRPGNSFHTVIRVRRCQINDIIYEYDK